MGLKIHFKGKIFSTRIYDLFPSPFASLSSIPTSTIVFGKPYILNNLVPPRSDYKVVMIFTVFYSEVSKVSRAHSVYYVAVYNFTS